MSVIDWQEEEDKGYEGSSESESQHDIDQPKYTRVQLLCISNPKD